MSAVSSYAQTATFTTAASGNNAAVTADTVKGLVQGAGGPTDNITASAASGVTIKWKAIASNFPSDWLVDSVLGICDNNQCHNNTNGTAIWGPFGTGTTFTSDLYKRGVPAGFYMSMNMTGTVTNGTYYITCLLSDANSGYSKTVTFYVSKWATGVTSITKTEDDVTLYPNPAADEVNVVYNPNSGVKNIAIYNIIGKVVKVYNTLDNSSAKLNIDNIPSGVYFIRVMDGQGHVVATRKFTRQ